MSIINVKTLREKQFRSLAFEGDWLELFGEPECNFKLLCYGKEKSGKSTMILRFADYLAKNFGKVFYNSHEEGHSKTFQDRVISNNIDAPKLFVGHKVGFSEMMDDSFKRRYYKSIIIDSLQYMNLTYSQYKHLTAKYKNKSFIFVSQINGRGKIKGGTDIAHAVDIKMFTFDGKARIQSRFTSEKVVSIFDKKDGQVEIFKNKIKYK